MKSSIITKLEILQERYEELEILLGDAAIISQQEYFRNLLKEYSELSEIVRCFYKWRSLQADLVTANELMKTDPELYEMAKEESKLGREKQAKLEEQLRLFLLPQDPDDKRNCFLEIHAGTGGDEASLFAKDLFRMYSRYAESQRWKVSLISASEGELGGYKDILIKIEGQKAYGTLKFESGGHRVQRVPVTESQGRVHTSTCTIAVLPEVPDEELPEINPSDLRIDTFRSSGAGGQHVNTTDSAIRIVHLPTGIVVECQDERSQHKNKAKALSVLSARIRASEKEKKSQEEASTRRNLLGKGERSDRNRTYNFPQGRVTDHRINLTLYCLEEIMQGNLNILIDPIMHEYQADQLASLSEVD